MGDAHRTSSIGIEEVDEAVLEEVVGEVGSDGTGRAAGVQEHAVCRAEANAAVEGAVQHVEEGIVLADHVAVDRGGENRKASAASDGDVPVDGRLLEDTRLAGRNRDVGTYRGPGDGVATPHGGLGDGGQHPDDQREGGEHADDESLLEPHVRDSSQDTGNWPLRDESGAQSATGWSACSAAKRTMLRSSRSATGTCRLSRILSVLSTKRPVPCGYTATMRPEE